jgi:hypothetical protein
MWASAGAVGFLQMDNFFKAALSQRSALLGIVAVFLFSAVLAIWSGSSLRYEDEIEYHELAQSLVHEHAFLDDRGRPTVARPPGYPLLLAAVYEIVDSALAAKILNCLALAGSCYLLIKLSRRLFPVEAALAPYLVLFYPLFAYAATTLYPQTIGGLLMLAVILLLSGDRRRRIHLVWAGLIYGALCLAIPSFLYIVPVLLAFLAFAGGKPDKGSLVRAAILAICIVLTIAPWTIRNAVESGFLVPISANGGINLAIGNSAFTPPDGKAALIKACPQLPAIPSEVAFDRVWAKCGIDYIRNNPGPELRLYLGKLLNYFNFRNEISTIGEQKTWQNVAVFATYYPLLIVALLRLTMVRRYRLSSLEALLYILYFANAALTAVFFTRLRFRIPFDLLLVAIDAAFIERLLSQTRAAPISDPASAC